MPPARLLTVTWIPCPHFLLPPCWAFTVQPFLLRLDRAPWSQMGRRHISVLPDFSSSPKVLLARLLLKCFLTSQQNVWLFTAGIPRAQISQSLLFGLRVFPLQEVISLWRVRIFILCHPTTFDLLISVFTEWFSGLWLLLYERNILSLHISGPYLHILHLTVFITHGTGHCALFFPFTLVLLLLLESVACSFLRAFVIPSSGTIFPRPLAQLTSLQLPSWFECSRLWGLPPHPSMVLSWSCTRPSSLALEPWSLKGSFNHSFVVICLMP